MCDILSDTRKSPITNTKTTTGDNVTKASKYGDMRVSPSRRAVYSTTADHHAL